MYRQLVRVSQLRHDILSIPDVARSGQLDALIALEQIGTRLRFSRNQEIYGQGESGGYWYKVVSGTVRISQLRTDGRRHIAEFCFSGDGFGIKSAAERSFSAEAVEDVTVMRYPRVATERLTEENPAVARLLRDIPRSPHREGRADRAAPRSKERIAPPEVRSAAHAVRYDRFMSARNGGDTLLDGHLTVASVGFGFRRLAAAEQGIASEGDDHAHQFAPRAEA